MSEREVQESQDQDEQEKHVEGVDLEPSGNTSIAVNTQDRLEARDDEPDFDSIPDEELEKERQERLDPDNRPDNVEVDNSQRDFDPETGLFEDSEAEPAEDAPYSTTEAEQSN